MAREKESEYSKKLRDPRWQKIRLQVFERDQWTCQRCLETEKTLHVHHLYYERGKGPWDYPLEALLTLCEECHEFEYLEMPASLALLGEALKRRGFLARDVHDLAHGFRHAQLPDTPELMATAIATALQSSAFMAEIRRWFMDLLGERAASAGEQPGAGDGK